MKDKKQNESNKQKDKKEYDKPISLYPLKTEEAVELFMQTKLEKNK